MIEKLIFNLVAFGIFIMIFFNMAKKNDTNYLYILFIEMLGIGINFFDQTTTIFNTIVFKVIEYMLAIVLPAIVLVLDKKEINFSEIIAFIKYFFINDTKKRQQILEEVLEKYPKSLYSHKFLENVYEVLSEYEKALLEQYKILELRTEDENEIFKIAELLYKLHKPKESEKVLRQLMRTNPEYINSNTLLAEIMYMQENYKEAFKIINDAISQNENNYSLYYELGMVNIALADFQAAKVAYEKVVELNSKLHNAVYTLAQIALASNDILEAEKQFLKASTFLEFEAISYYELSKINIIKNNKDEALSYLKKAVELDEKYFKIARDEKIFNTIKEQISLIDEKNTIDKKASKRMEYLSKLEEATRAKLKNTIEVVEELSFKQRDEYYEHI